MGLEQGAIKRVCVYCGSRSGTRPVYLEAARAMGRALAGAGMGVVYGGASVGLMGALADAALQAGGEVIGVMPRTLTEREIAHPGLTQLHVVETMHARKAQMEALADAFIAMPGGLGTLDELFEILTWAQLGLHAKPCGLLDTGEYYARLIGFLDGAVREGFLSTEHRRMLAVDASPCALLEALQRHRPPAGKRWVARSQI